MNEENVEHAHSGVPLGIHRRTSAICNNLGGLSEVFCYDLTCEWI